MNVAGGFEFLILFFIEFLLAFLSSAFLPMTSRRKKLYLNLSLGILAIMTMFHNFSVGNDTMHYVMHFRVIAKFANIKDALSYGRFESGYTAYVWLLSRISKNPQILFLVTGAIIYVSLFRFLNRWVNSPGLFIVLYVATLKFDSNLSTIRQALALSIVLLCFDFAVEKKLLKFAITTLLAASFHNVALAFVIAYPLINIGDSYNENGQHRPEKVLFLLTCAGFVAFQPLLNLVIRYFPIYQYYLGGIYTDGNVRLATVINIIVCLLMLSVPHFVFEKEEYEEKDVAIWRLSLVNLGLTVISMNATLIARVSSLFGLFPLIYYNERVSGSMLQGNKRVMLILSIVLFGLEGFVITMLKTPDWYTTYPFVWCWQ